MTPYAFAAGALLAALAGPWAALGLLALPALPRSARGPLALGLGLVLLRIWTLGDPWAGRLGERVVLEGALRGGVLRTAPGPLYLRTYPPPADGWVRVEGRVARPEGARLPGGFDRRAWLRGLGVQAELREVRLLEHRPPPPGLRDPVRANLLRGLGPEAAGLARALTLGERAALGDDVQAFRRAGLAHALALSGLHVGILAGFFVLLAAPLGRGRYLAALALLLGYLALVGPSPSLVRAALMAGVWLLARAAGLVEVPLASLLALALGAQLVLTPYAAASLSFQLSYLAVLGIALALPLLPQQPRWKAGLFGGLGLTLAAQAATLPLVLDRFGYLPLASPLANLVLLPLVGLLVPLGFLKAALPALSGLLAAPFNLTAELLLGGVRLFAQVPGLHWGALDAGGYALYYLALAPLVLAGYRLLRPRTALALAAAAALVAAATADRVRPDVWFLDVGQGDAALVRLPGGVEILVDAGHAWDARGLARALAALGVDDLDLAVGTHPDADHTGGLPGLLELVPVGRLALGPPKPTDPLDARLRAAARARGVPVVNVSRGEVLRLGGAELRFLHPPAAAPGKDNDRSLVFVLEYRGRRLLFTGDAPARHALAWPPERVDVLKVAHHGAADGTSEALLRRFRPRIAWIGVGPNAFGHPDPGVLRRLAAWNVRVLRADRDGSVRLPLR
ncbi:DNA internalization-related competence protein ComEC/Rec2 [Oceanithermus profundus DSM 14977]|uniref:DNA internalization-related competence protein ComEC/Rec2 n=1 Tax=Oceanithermus profundus (strain DSM 14977 / NBRC 100410 / VKM B-2274 / 506) TaxID=670487 RepID=E4U5F9_OCEP5|nr:DNA internalization-related competence protein ComEC/Rec2 [Oceanithermus profundus]ADR37691.1 DNA internalization-related competence protein ComEC/Rec2 [Oceanithermus profundus DSM 14977]